MSERVVTVTLDVGKPFETGETCPECGFDCVLAILLLVNSSPRFTYVCGRTVCRDEHGRLK